MDTVFSNAGSPGLALSVPSTGSSKTVVTVQIGNLGTSRFNVLYRMYLCVLVFLVAKTLLSQAGSEHCYAERARKRSVGRNGVSTMVLGGQVCSRSKPCLTRDRHGPDSCSLRLVPVFVRPIHLDLLY